MYEFLDKSLQFSTADINKNAPEVFNSIVQPSASVTITNGAVTDLSFNGNIISFDLNYIENNLKDSYSAATNVSLTGGNGSGAVADIEVGDDGRISALILVNGGQDYEFPATSLPYQALQNPLDLLQMLLSDSLTSLL